MSNNRRGRWQKGQVKDLISKQGSEWMESSSKMREENEGVVISKQDVDPTPMEIARKLNACSITEYLMRTDFPECAIDQPVMVNGVVGYLQIVDSEGKMFAVLEATTGEVHIFESQRLRDQFNVVRRNIYDVRKRKKAGKKKTKK